LLFVTGHSIVQLYILITDLADSAVCTNWLYLVLDEDVCTQFGTN